MDMLLRSSVRARLAAARLRDTIEGRRERGDVPGWVLITLMTAGIVVVLWSTARTQLMRMFNAGMDSFHGPK